MIVADIQVSPKEVTLSFIDLPQAKSILIIFLMLHLKTLLSNIFEKSN